MGWITSSKVPPGTSLLATCGSLHMLAKKAYERTALAPDRAPEQDDALSAIILSVVSLEAFIGELVEVVRGLAPYYPEDSRNRGKALICNDLSTRGNGFLLLSFLS